MEKEKDAEKKISGIKAWKITISKASQERGVKGFFLSKSFREKKIII